MLESTYQARLIKTLRKRLPGCVVLKNDANYLQGFPDLTIFYGPRWGCLEVKISADADIQPNQEWYVEHLNRMSFARFIFPENEREVLSELQQALWPGRSTRVSQPQPVSLDSLR